ncbi:trimeric LpxA-like protein [Hyaloraphidium curvatum]|nr:trimeric LpxA-like protein [Hyaloraphidium curvatum]
MRCCGGHAHSVWENVAAEYAGDLSSWLCAVWDDSGALHPALAGFALLRTREEAVAWVRGTGAAEVHAFAGHGLPGVRRELVAGMRAAFPSELQGVPRLVWPNAVHPTAYVPEGFEMGEGNLVGSFTKLGPHARVGSFCMIGAHCLVAHDAVVHDYAQMNAANVLGGHSVLGEGCVMGINSCAADHAEIAPWTRIGMNAALVRSITVGGGVWIGTPARPMARKREGKEGPGEHRGEAAAAKM